MNELPHDLPNDLRLDDLKIQNIKKFEKKSQRCFDFMTITQLTAQIATFFIRKLQNISKTFHLKTYFT